MKLNRVLLYIILMISLMILLTSCNESENKKQIIIYPVAKEVQSGEVNINISKVDIINDNVDEIALKELKDFFKSKGIKEKNNAKVKLFIGKKDSEIISKEVSKVGLSVNDNHEGYILYAKEDTIILSANDDRGLFYAIQTFKELVSGKSIKEVNINDWPSMGTRGIIEGFYGAPWSHEDRLSLIRLSGQFKMNTYIYAPKDDPKHRSQWRDDYVGDELTKMQDLIDTCKDNYVDFVFSISPGGDIRFDKYYEFDLKALIQKSESMYNLGVRHFAIFLDDIPIMDADDHAKLINDFQAQFIDTKNDVDPLICIFTEYTDPMYTKEYTDKIGSLVNDKSVIMWTGPAVVPESISNKDLEKINRIYKRNVLIWWNYPVNDYNTESLFIGPCMNLDINLNEVVTGLVANPMNQAESSKLPLLTTADYLWNPASYDSEKSYDYALGYLFPGLEKEIKLFSEYVKANTINGNSDSQRIMDLFEQYSDLYDEGKDTKEIKKQIIDEFVNIKEAVNKIKNKCKNDKFIKESENWLNKLHDYAVMGENLFKAADDNANRSKYINKYNDAKAKVLSNKANVSVNVLEAIFDNEESPAFIEAGVKEKIECLEAAPFTNFNQYEDYGIENIVDGKKTTYFWSSGAPWQAASPNKGYIALDVKEVKKINNIYIATGSSDTDLDIMGKAVIEYSVDNENWTELKKSTFSNVIYLDNIDIDARYVRIRTLDTDTSYWIKMRLFELNTTRKP